MVVFVLYHSGSRSAECTGLLFKIPVVILYGYFPISQNLKIQTRNTQTALLVFPKFCGPLDNSRVDKGFDYTLVLLREIKLSVFFSEIAISGFTIYDIQSNGKPDLWRR